MVYSYHQERREAMMVKFFPQIIGLLVSILCLTGCALESDQFIEIEKKNLFPEGIAFDAVGKRFFLSSLSQGHIGVISKDKTYTIFADEADLYSTVGLHVDASLGVLLACLSDPGVSARSSAYTKDKVSGLAVYNLETGNRDHVYDLGRLVEGPVFANDVAPDGQGHAYVTDSFSPVIYKVDLKSKKASVFFRHDRFKGKGYNLNGIVYHPDGYLVVSKYNEGVFFKIPVRAPGQFQEIKVSQKLRGADGLVLVEKNQILVVQNELTEGAENGIYLLETKDDFANAKLRSIGEGKLLNSPTTAVRTPQGHVFAVESFIKKLFEKVDQSIFRVVKVL
jgi:hypothetical protein